MAEEKKIIKPFSLEALMNPEVSRVARDTNGLIITLFGPNGTGKTAQMVRMEKPFYLSLGQTGLSGINNIPFAPINSWSDFKAFTKTFCDHKNYSLLHEQYQTIIIDELEILWRYLTKYICAANGVAKIEDIPYGGGYNKRQEEWEDEMLKLIGSRFCLVVILHSTSDENGRAIPMLDKRGLPIFMNHSEIICYAKPQPINKDTGKAGHSSLLFANTDEAFARTHNEYFVPMIEDFTAENLINAYYEAIDRQEAAEGVKAISREEKNKKYETEVLDFEKLMGEVQEAGGLVAEKFGREKITEIVEKTLGAGALVSNCGPRQAEQVRVILSDLQDLLGE